MDKFLILGSGFAYHKFFCIITMLQMLQQMFFNFLPEITFCILVLFMDKDKI